MSLSILVCHSYFLRFDRKQQARAKPYPPLATLQVASTLRNAGHEIAFFDAMLADGLEDYESFLKAAQPQLVLFYEDNYNFLSKMCLGRMRRACFEMISSARHAGARAIAAGSDATDAPERYLSAGADIVLLGEGLRSLSELVRRLDNDHSLPVTELVAGLPDAASLTGSPATKKCTPALASAPELPRRPAWDLIDIEQYRTVWRGAHGYFSLNMAASRGCSFRCNWCAKPIWGNQYLQRAPRDVADEMLHLKREHGPDHIWFADDIFGFRVDWVQQFAEALADGGGGIPFTIQLRADLVSPRMSKALREAGCTEVWLGAESGSQKILDAMNKGTTVSQILRARELLRTENVRVGFFLMLGYLGEELDDVLATRDLVDCARPDDVGVSVAYPLPGTRFYDLVKYQLGDKKNWQESDDLEMMFSGTYSSEFYHLVRDLLHDQVTEGLSPEMRRRWDALVADEARYRREQEGGALLAAGAVP